MKSPVNNPDTESGTFSTLGNVADYKVTTGTILQCPRTTSSIPSGYRLARKSNGEYVLQAAYVWSEGLIRSGIDWHDTVTIPWVEEVDKVAVQVFPGT